MGSLSTLAGGKNDKGSSMWELSGLGGMLVILLVGMLLKDRKVKYRMRLLGYGYMFVLESALFWKAEGVGYSTFHACLAGVWVGLAYKDIKTTRILDRGFARLERLEAESKLVIAQLFYHRRN